MVKIACAVDEIRSLTSGETEAILDKDKRGEFLPLDVRQPEEYEAEAHVDSEASDSTRGKRAGE